VLLLDTFDQSAEIDLPHGTTVCILDPIMAVDRHIDYLQARKHRSIFFHDNLVVVNSLMLRSDAQIYLEGRAGLQCENIGLNLDVIHGVFAESDFL
jgi:hypothetical protein